MKQPAASTGGESRAGARDARLSRGLEGVMSRQQQTNWTRTAEHQAAEHQAAEHQAASAAEDIQAKWQTREIFRLKINNGGHWLDRQSPIRRSAPR